MLAFLIKSIHSRSQLSKTKNLKTNRYYFKSVMYWKLKQSLNIQYTCIFVTFFSNYLNLIFRNDKLTKFNYKKSQIEIVFLCDKLFG